MVEPKVAFVGIQQSSARNTGVGEEFDVRPAVHRLGKIGRVQRLHQFEDLFDNAASLARAGERESQRSESSFVRLHHEIKGSAVVAVVVKIGGRSYQALLLRCP